MRCRIYVEKEAFEVNEPVVLTITIENVSQKASSYFESQPNTDFTVDSKMENGAIVYPTAYAKDRVEMPFYGCFIRYVESGQRLTYKLTVNRLIDMTKSGTYNITITRYALKQPNNHAQIKAMGATVKPINGMMTFKGIIDSPVISNTIQVKVIEADASLVVISSPDTDADGKAAK